MALASFQKFPHLWRRLERRHLPEYAWQADRLTFWRERILLTLLLLSVYFAPLALVPSVALALVEGRWAVAAIDALAYGVALAVFFNQNRSLAVRAWVVCLLVFALGAGLMFMLGPHGAGYMWLFASSVLAAGLIGLGAGAWMLLFAFLVFALVAVGLAADLLPWAGCQPNPLQQWLVMGANFMLLNSFITIITARMLEGLKEALESEQAVSADLRISEARFRSLGENAPDVIFTINAQGRFTYVNPTVDTALGYSPPLLIGTRLAEIGSPEHSQDIEKAMEDVFVSGRTVQGMEVVLLDSRGKEVHFILSAAPRLNQNNQVEGMVGLLKDITEMRLLEAQLHQAQKMEAVGTLAGGIAHDFNNLLAAITGYAEIAHFNIEDGIAPSRELDQILDISDKGKELVRGILTFSRKVDPILKPIDFNHQVSLAVDMLRRIIPRMITIELDLAEGLPLVLMDASQLSQVLMNLGSNARDAMPDGGMLTITTRQVELNEEQCRPHEGCKPGVYLHLSVSDTGQGMDQETLEHIFDPFFTQKEIGKGTGLGLAMVFGIVKNHGGHVTCQSSPGRGTRFDLYWPYHPGQTQPDLNPAQEERLSKPLDGPHTVLVVDDEAALRETASGILGKCGLETIQAENGEQALALYLANPEKIDLVLLDINMPGMGGVRCLDELLAFDSRLKVVIVSGYAPNQPESRPRDAAAAYIAKPYRADELTKTVLGVLNNAKL